MATKQNKNKKKDDIADAPDILKQTKLQNYMQATFNQTNQTRDDILGAYVG